MSTKKLSNITLKLMIWYLESNGLKEVNHCKGRGGHMKFVRKDLTRPIIIQSHIDPVPEFIVIQILRHLSVSKKEFFVYIEKNY